MAKVALSVASGGDLDGDAIDDLLVSIGGTQPSVQVFRGREDWDTSAPVIRADFELGTPDPTTDGDLLFGPIQENTTSIAVLPAEVPTGDAGTRALLDGLMDLTVEFWHRMIPTDVSSGGGWVFSSAGADPLTSGFAIGSDIGQVQIAVGANIFSTNALLDSDGFHHVAVVRDTAAQQYRIYIDGELADTLESAVPLGAIESEIVLLGQRVSGIDPQGGYFLDPSPLQARLDELRIWEGVRSQ